MNGQPNKTLLILTTLFVVGSAGIQFVPVQQTNPPVEMPFSTSPEVEEILRVSCYDCHSNETSWPWYSRIAPMSWVIAKDVNEGRKRLNFSDWGFYSEMSRAEVAADIADELGDNEMPKWQYTITHPGAKLDKRERQVLLKWAEDFSLTGTEQAARE